MSSISAGGSGRRNKGNARPEKVLVFGMAATGWAVAAALRARGHDVVLADDAAEVQVPDSSWSDLAGSEQALHNAPTEAELRELVSSVTAVSPSPGVPGHHQIYRLAAELDRPVWGDFDLAARWDDRPIAAITGTNGKTTVTTLVATMLQRSGVTAVEAGNTALPLVAAIDQYPQAEMFVVEASSFRLAVANNFAPQVAAWLNFAPDHLDWHGSIAAYEAAKSRIWRLLDRPGKQPRVENPGVAVFPYGDQAITAHIPTTCKAVSFASADCLASHFDGKSSSPGDVTVVGGHLCAFGEEILPVAAMTLRRPHDIANAAAAAAVSLEMGATREAVAAVLTEFEGLPHRLSKVATVDGVSFYNDSKATTPHAVLAGLAGFADVVLIAGGRNKGTDLTALQALTPRLRAVVAIGEAAGEVASAFGGLVPVELATSMNHAVRLAMRLATLQPASQATTAQVANASPRADVVLSPACASFDWYRDYTQRGEDFTAEVLRLEEANPARASQTRASQPGASQPGANQPGANQPGANQQSAGNA